MAKVSKTFERQLAKAVAEKIRMKRVAVGISQEKLGERAKIHRTYIGALERGEKNATLVTLAKIAIALRCRLVDLLPQDVID